ncbi:MAG TPA: hypothetical protein HA304_00130 [Methanosarcinales archaeon]|nr:hypothetical protein [Methanosarcinales archaeon]
MRNQLIIGNIFIIIMLLLVPTINADKTNSNLIRELSTIDSFHPDNNLTYKEWHYFNIIDEDPDLKFFVTFNIGGNVSNPYESYSNVLMAYDINNNVGQSVNSCSIVDTYYSNETPDVEINNSYVKLLPNGYEVYAESTDGNIVFSATFIPMASPSTVFSGLIGDSGEMNWVTAAPVCKVNGDLTINGMVYSLDGVRGYHDHNWGRWTWCDNIGWDWGQAIEPNDEADTDVGRYGMTIGRLTNGSHTMDGISRLQIWKNKKQIAAFNNVIFSYDYGTDPCPPLINATAKSGEDFITSIFETSKGLPIEIGKLSGEGCNSTIWELTGNYTVSGTIDGKPIYFQAEGFAEYAEYIY